MPIELYGESQCNKLFPVVSSKNSLAYLQCLVKNDVARNLKETCKILFVGNDDLIFNCRFL